MIPSQLEKQCKIHKIKGIYLIPNCANPTTITIPLERRKELAYVIQQNHLTLIEDDIASWLLAIEKKVLPSMYDILNKDSIYICGMTKSLCPGLRIAYIAFAERYRKKIMHGLANTNIKTSSLDAEIITELLLNGNAYKIAKKKYMWTKQNCLLFQSYFSQCTSSNKVSYYQWIPIHVNKSFREIENELLKRGIRVYHSHRFTVEGHDTQNYLRVSLCSARTSTALKQGLEILKQYLDENSI